jgi:hypothetical protein
VLLGVVDDVIIEHIHIREREREDERIVNGCSCDGNVVLTYVLLLGFELIRGPQEGGS